MSQSENILGNKIKSERLIRKMNQPQLAKKLNVTKQTVSNWENGYRIPDTMTLNKLANLFDVSIDYLLGNYVKQKRTSSNVAEESADYDFEESKSLIIQELGKGVEIHFHDAKKLTPEQLKIFKALYKTMVSEDEEK